MRNLIIVVFMILVFTGCGLPTYAVKTARTPDISVCDNFKGKNKISVEKELGKPVKVKGDERTYKRGYFSAKVSYENDTVKTIECETE